jgi:hypothetical protein
MLRKGLGCRSTCAGKDGSSTRGPLTATSKEGLRPVGGGEARMTSREPLCRIPLAREVLVCSSKRLGPSKADGQRTRTRETILVINRLGGVGPGTTPIRNCVLSMFDSQIPVESVWLCKRRTRLNARPSSPSAQQTTVFGSSNLAESRLIKQTPRSAVSPLQRSIRE